MKKAFGMLLVLVLVLTMCACNAAQLLGDTTQQIQDEDPQQTTSDAPADGRYKLTVVDYWGYLIEPLDEYYKAGEEVEVTLAFLSGPSVGIELNGKYIGEVDMDAYIAAEKGMPSRFFAGGDISCNQAKRAVSDIVTVTTKTELSRNEAVFRDNEELFADIKKAIVSAVRTDAQPQRMSFPAMLEKSFKRTEDAAKYLRRVRAAGLDADYLSDDILGKDGHTVVSTIRNISDFIAGI